MHSPLLCNSVVRQKRIGRNVTMVTRWKLGHFSRISATHVFQGHSSSLAIHCTCVPMVPFCRPENLAIEMPSEFFDIISKFPSGNPGTSKSVCSWLLTFTHLNVCIFVLIQEYKWIHIDATVRSMSLASSAHGCQAPFRTPNAIGAGILVATWLVGSARRP